MAKNCIKKNVYALIIKPEAAYVKALDERAKNVIESDPRTFSKTWAGALRKAKSQGYVRHATASSQSASVFGPFRHVRKHHLRTLPFFMLASLAVFACTSNIETTQARQDHAEAATASKKAWFQDFAVEISGGDAALTISGDGLTRAIVSGPHDIKNPRTVTVYTLKNNQWVVEQTLVAPDGWRDQSFGTKVAIFDDTAAVASPSNNPAVYVYKRSTESGWGLVQKLYTKNAYQFGASLALDGTTLAVGEAAPDSGTLYIYRRGADGKWGTAPTTENASHEPQQTFAGTNLGVGFADRIALRGDWLLARAPNRHNPKTTNVRKQAGAIVVFHRGADKLWAQKATVLTRPAPYDAYLLGDQGSGLSMALSEDSAFIGDPKQNLVFRYAIDASKEPDTWSVETIEPGTSALASNAKFGGAVAANQEHLLVGIPKAGATRGAVDAYRIGSGGSPEAPLRVVNLSTKTASGLGTKILLSQDRAVVTYSDGALFLHHRDHSMHFDPVGAVVALRGRQTKVPLSVHSEAAGDLRFLLVDAPTGVSIVKTGPTTAEVQWTPGANATEGTHSIRLKAVHNLSGEERQHTLEIEVKVDETWSVAPQTTIRGQPLLVELEPLEQVKVPELTDAKQLSMSINESPEGAYLEETGTHRARLKWTPGETHPPGDYTIGVEVVGTDGYTAKTSIVVQVLPSCGNGILDSWEQCEKGNCCDLKSCQFHLAGKVCQPAVGQCQDEPEICSGTSAVCPPQRQTCRFKVQDLSTPSETPKPPTIIASFPFQGTTVATVGRPLQVIGVYVDDLPSKPKSVLLVDEHGNDLTSRARVLPNSIELNIDNAVHGDHRYTLTIEDQTGIKTQRMLSFRVDATSPVTSVSRDSATIHRESLTVNVQSSENGQIYYSTDGYPPAIGAPNTKLQTVKAKTPFTLEFTQDTIFQFFAVDGAGNREPIRKKVYLFHHPRTLESPQFSAVLSEAGGHRKVEFRWKATNTEDATYHVYQALTPHDRKLLEDSRQGGYPAPRVLRAHIVRLANPLSGGSDSGSPLQGTQTIFAGGLTTWYGLAAVQDGQETILSPLIPIDLPPHAQHKSGDAQKRALAWLKATQDKTGHWGSPGMRLIATSQVLKAMAKLKDKSLGSRRALSFLRSQRAEDTDSLTHKIAALRAHGINTDALSIRLLGRASFQEERILGFGVDPKSLPDAVNTARGLEELIRADFDSSNAHLLTIPEGIDLKMGLPLAGPWRIINTVGSKNGFGWGAKSIRSVYATSLLTQTLRNYVPGATLEAAAWAQGRQNLETSSDLCGSFGGNIMDTAAAVLALNLGPQRLALAKAWLRKTQKMNGSWKDDPYLTAFVLEALLPAVQPDGTLQKTHLYAAASNTDGFATETLSGRVGSLSTLPPEAEVAWTVASGPENGIEVLNPKSLDTKLRIHTPGEYHLKVEAQVGNKAVAETHRIIVGPGPRIIRVERDTMQIALDPEGEALVDLHGTVLDKTIPNLSVQWTTKEHPGVPPEFEFPNKAQTSATLRTVGKYVLALTAKGDGVQESVFVQIEVLPSRSVVPMANIEKLTLDDSKHGESAGIAELILEDQSTPQGAQGRWTMAYGHAGVNFMLPRNEKSQALRFHHPGRYVIRRTDRHNMGAIYQEHVVFVKNKSESYPDQTKVFVDAGENRMVGRASNGATRLNLRGFVFVPYGIDPATDVVLEWTDLTPTKTAVIRSPSLASTFVDLPQAGEYIFELAATVGGAITRDQVHVRVTPDLNEELLVHWSFDRQEDATIPDLSENGRQGTIVGQPALVATGVDGNHALQLGGGLGGVRFRFKDDFAAELPRYTISFWAKATNTKWALTERRLMYMLEWDNQIRFETTFNDNEGVDQKGIDVYRINARAHSLYFGQHGRLEDLGTTRWVNLAVRYDGRFLRNYVNGIEQQTEKLSPSNAGTLFKHLSVGQSIVGSNAYKGIVDDVRLYGRALTNDEVKAIYTASPLKE